MRCYVDMLLNTSTANIKTWERDNGLYGGLFPLVRGTLGIGAIAALCVRFIPAGAGNSLRWPRSRPLSAVYPRWRGELLWTLTPAIRINGGLSPLARGTLFYRRVCWNYTRFIPAGAGNSNSIYWRYRLISVYPRWRGELLKTGNLRLVLYGLSPLARGTRIRPLGLFGIRRFIPAGAGNSSTGDIFSKSWPVYPRWRGELVRVAPETIFQVRFIPAGAGNSCAGRL